MEEVLAGQINHALRFTAPKAQRQYSAQARVLIRVLKRYGLIYADQGSSG